MYGSAHHSNILASSFFLYKNMFYFSGWIGSYIYCTLLTSSQSDVLHLLVLKCGCLLYLENEGLRNLWLQSNPRLIQSNLRLKCDIWFERRISHVPNQIQNINKSFLPITPQFYATWNALFMFFQQSIHVWYAVIFFFSEVRIRLLPKCCSKRILFWR